MKLYRRLGLRSPLLRPGDNRLCETNGDLHEWNVFWRRTESEYHTVGEIIRGDNNIFYLRIVSNIWSISLIMPRYLTDLSKIQTALNFFISETNISKPSVILLYSPVQLVNKPLVEQLPPVTRK